MRSGSSAGTAISVRGSLYTIMRVGQDEYGQDVGQSESRLYNIIAHGMTVVPRKDDICHGEQADIEGGPW